MKINHKIVDPGTIVLWGFAIVIDLGAIILFLLQQQGNEVGKWWATSGEWSFWLLGGISLSMLSLAELRKFF